MLSLTPFPAVNLQFPENLLRLETVPSQKIGLFIEIITHFYSSAM
jgi:hypothetical protein